MNITNYKLDIDLDIFKIIYLITVYYSIYFFGAYPNDLEFNIFNLGLIIAPSLILYGLHKTIEIKRVKINLSIASILIGFLSFIVFVIYHFYNPNLISDEIYYAHKSIRFPLEIVNAINLIFNIEISNYKLYVKLISFGFLATFILISKSKYFYKFLKFNLLSIILIRTVFWIVTGGIPLVHPPLSSLFSSILIIPFVINDFTFKIATCLFFFTSIILLFNYLKYSLKNQLFFYAFLILFPIIGNNLLIHEQSVYYSIFLFFTIVLIDKIPISQISILIGVSILFRQSSIVLAVIPFIMTIRNYKSFSQSFKNLYGVLIGLPVFFKSLIFGTPSSPNPSSLINKLQNINFNLYDLYDFKYLLFVIILIGLLLIIKEYKKLFFLILASILYILIFNLTRMSFGSKYIFELYGSYLFILIFISSKIKNTRIIALMFLLIFTVNFNFKDKFIYKNNSFSEILKILEENSPNTLFIKNDYYNFSRLLKSKSINDFDEKFKYDIKYHKDLMGADEVNTVGSFQLSHLLNYSQLPTHIVFMESNFNKLNELDRSQILKYFKIDFQKDETFDSYAYVILKLR